MLLLLVVIPLLGFSQTPLVKWFQTNLQPTLLENHIGSAPIIGAQNLEWGSDNVFYTTNGNFSNSSSPDPAKYIQFSVNSQTGYQIKPSHFTFAVRKQGGDDNQKIQVKYSKNSDFSSAETLLEETNVPAAYKNFDIAFPTNTIVFSGETLYVRVYVYNTYNNLHIQHNLSGSIAPTLFGKVDVEVPVKPTAIRDTAATLKNQSVIIDILANDDFRFIGNLSSINPIKPTHGTVVVNGLKDVTYIPNPEYVGYDRFSYTLTNTVGESNSALVEVQVLDGSEVVLARWNKSDFTPVDYVSGLKGSAITLAGGLLVSNFDSYWVSNVEYRSFKFTGMPINTDYNGTVDSKKYMQFAISSTLLDEAVILKKLNLEYNAHGTGNITIKYSTDPLFVTGVKTLVDDRQFTETSYSSWSNLEAPFDLGAVLNPSKTIYIRMYIYNRSYVDAPFYIKSGLTKDANVLSGPIVTGIQSKLYEQPCSKTVTWDGSKWSGEPNINTKVEINGNYTTSSGGFEACSLTVNSGKLTIAPQTSITVQNEVIVVSNSTAALIVNSDGNLIQHNDQAINSGIISVERKANLKRLDYIYWASPVKNQNLKTFSPGTVNTRFYVYNEGNDLSDVINPVANSFGNAADGSFESAAKGYGIRASNFYPAATATVPAPTQTFNAVFKGVPNNGEIIFPLQYRSLETGSGNNLVGNPYPSNIDFNELVKNNSELIEGTAYLWTNLNPNPAMQGSNYPSGGYFNNYATLNRIGGVAATKGTARIAGDNPTQIIKVGQGFIVKAKKAGALVFNNSIRTADKESVFISKSANTTSEKDRFWLQLTSPMEVVTTTLIGYTLDAHDSFDKDEDAQLLVVGDDALYTQVEDYKLGIQGKQGPLRTNDVVSLGMNHYEEGSYSISLGQRDGVFAKDQAVYLKDKQTGIVTNLSSGDYAFTAGAGENSGRFEIIYESQTTLATDAAIKEKIVVYKENGDFVLKAASKKITSVELFDMSGRLILKLQANATKVTVPSGQLHTGAYIIKINQNELITSKKIIK